MGLESEQLCPAARMLQEIMSNKTAESDPYLYLDPHPRVSRLPRPQGSNLRILTRCTNGCAAVRAEWLDTQTGSRSSGVVRQHKPFNDAIAFAIGGGNYVEHEQVLRLVRSHLRSHNCDCVILIGWLRTL